MTVRSVILFLLLVGTVWADPDIVLPDKINTTPGRLVKIAATSPAGKTIKFLNPDPEHLDMIPSESGRWVIVAATTPGVYRIAAWTVIAGEPTDAAICVLTVTGFTPPIPPSPVPPTPTPPNPGPQDQFTKDLLGAYASDSEDVTTKKSLALKLANYYQQSIPITSDKSLLNGGMLSAALHKTSVGSGLLNTRRWVSDQLVSILGNDPTYELTDDKRKAVAELFAKLSAVLGGIK